MSIGPGCAKKVGLEEQDFQQSRDKDLAKEELSAQLKNKMGCFYLCIMEERGNWKDGGLDTSEMERKMPNAKDALQQCAAEKGDNDCDRAYQIMRCLKSKIFN